MKLTGRDAAAFLRKPDPERAGILIFGSDAVRVADARAQVVAALVGPQAEAEMRLTRLPAGDLRRDPAALDDAVKAQGFFPGPRVACVDDATDGLSKLFDSILSDWRPGDAQIVATAGQLNAKSALRKAFEGHRNAVAIGLYDDPPGRDEIEAMVAAAGLTELPRDVMDTVQAMAQSLSPSDLRQTIDKLGLYMRGSSAPATVTDLQLCAPAAAEIDTDDILEAICAGQTDRIAGLLRELYAQGTVPTTLCIGAMRHFRQLHTIASDPGGAGQGIGKLRPPVFGPRRDRMMRQASQWGRPKLEQAISVLTDTDLTLRSASRAPQAPVMERTLIRLAMMAGR
ncbi:DNA polymerase III subunit delta [Salipiger sp. IMCC34102]|uniref:DNA polymerase III subunit delta n=1 Tax=Salipiger sp. IMCC34102 TaxID=2510647 RepID=UPI00101BFDA1|nr:DNA polymerase III subunit delta [Salipiger sp. IMCC34102]RYH04030.1 DNA polymerase III subunit delta [Salipiger sp. IMCC34102]